VVGVGEPLDFLLHVNRPDDRKATVCLFAEHTRLLAHHVLALAPGRYAVSLPTRPDFAPGVHLRAILLEGGQIWEASRAVTLYDPSRTLDIEIETDLEDYLAGAPCSVTLRVRDSEGRPVPGAEVSLGIVYEAIYLLEQPSSKQTLYDIFHDYVPPRYPRGVFDGPPPGFISRLIWTGPKRAWGRFEEGSGEFAWNQKSGPPTWPDGALYLHGFGGGGGRFYLSDPLPTGPATLHWAPALVTDKDGTARTGFTFPNEETRWRFTAHAVTPDSRVGRTEAIRSTHYPKGGEPAP
jgi:uncharacterized protein YfaS (alpha-2-macroglobulin family)